MTPAATTPGQKGGHDSDAPRTVVASGEGEGDEASARRPAAAAAEPAPRINDTGFVSVREAGSEQSPPLAHSPARLGVSAKSQCPSGDGVTSEHALPPTKTAVCAKKAGVFARRTRRVDPVRVRAKAGSEAMSAAVAPTAPPAGSSSLPNVAMTAVSTAAGLASAAATVQAAALAVPPLHVGSAASNAAVPLRAPNVVERSVPSLAATTASSKRGQSVSRTVTESVPVALAPPAAPAARRPSERRAPVAPGARKRAETIKSARDRGEDPAQPAPPVAVTVV